MPIRMKDEITSGQSKNRCQGVVIGLSVIAVALVVLYMGNPVSESWPLKCLLYLFTGWQCPLCGSQRAIHEMLHGNVVEAWNYNPALWLVLPYFGIWAAGAAMPSLEEHKFVRWARKDGALAMVAVALLLWGVMRNL